MNKIWLIVKREYLTRVKKKTFILTTILTPLLIVGLIITITIVTMNSVEKERIAVIDKTGQFEGVLESSNTITFDFNTAIDTNNYNNNGYTGALFLTDDSTIIDKYRLYSRKQISLIAKDRIENQINNAIENRLLKERYNIDTKTIDSVRKEAQKNEIKNYLQTGEKKTEIGNSELAYGVGYGAAFLIYITLFIYGTMVMRGVMEEKMNRIAEVIVSSVKPFQLMMGKIIGIGAVGITQFLIWVVLIMVLSTVAFSFVPHEALQQMQQMNQQFPSAGSMANNEAISKLAEIKVTMAAVNWPVIIGCFLFFFLFGYLFYASLFAAVGSAVNEDPQDAQSLMLPITMPIVFAIIIMINAITNPTSSMAVWSSLIPFFSPIVMMARIPFGVPGTVPWWQLGTSMILLVLGFLFTTWISAKIYRTGILLYGKKVTLKELAKWALRSS